MAERTKALAGLADRKPSLRVKYAVIRPSTYFRCDVPRAQRESIGRSDLDTTRPPPTSKSQASARAGIGDRRVDSSRMMQRGRRPRMTQTKTRMQWKANSVAPRLACYELGDTTDCSSASSRSWAPNCSRTIAGSGSNKHRFRNCRGHVKDIGKQWRIALVRARVHAELGPECARRGVITWRLWQKS
jgi:hypothetical protein